MATPQDARATGTRLNGHEGRLRGQIKQVGPISRNPAAGGPAATWAANDRARDLPGWEPTLDLDDIITSAWDWFSRAARQDA